MPPKKQSTLGYVKTQRTLGSFFSLPAGQKPPIPQQTKLKRKKEPVRQELSASEDEVKDTASDGDAMEGVETESETTENSKKRPRTPEEPKVKNEKEDEPVAKKGRKDLETAPAKIKNGAATAESEKSESRDEPVKRRVRPKKDKSTTTQSAEKASGSEDEPVTKKGRKSKPTTIEETEKEASASESEPVKKRGKPPKKTAKAETVVSEGSGDDLVTTKEAAKKPKRKTKKKATTTEEKEMQREAEDSAIEEKGASVSNAKDPAETSDVEAKKPEITEKARKEVQAELTKGRAAHPYPDWKEGASVPYAALVKTFNLIEATTKRLEKLSHTSLLLRQVLRLTPDELLPVVHLMINRLAADYEGVELGIGETSLMKAISETCGRDLAKLKADHREVGDLGEVAMKSRNTQKTLFPPKPLTIKGVHSALKEIATTKGDGGLTRKIAGVKKLLSAAKGDEAKYLVRGLEGKLRLGLQERTVIVALSQAAIVHEAEQSGKKVPSLEKMTEAEEIIKSVYSELPNYEIIIREMLKNGIMNLKDTCKLQPGVPLKPMLAKPTKAIAEVFDRFEGERFTCEYKYDGERTQIHYVRPSCTENYAAVDHSTGISKIFSRNSEDLSSKYPDILAALSKWVKPDTESFILDCEAVAWDRDEKRVLPFQQLMTRKRKDASIEDIKVKVKVFGFDLLFLNGKNLVREPLSRRRELMNESFVPSEHEFALATSIDGQDPEMIQTFLEESIKASCEGLMVKMLAGEQSYYEPSRRSLNWLKVKKDYLAAGGDSLDLVVIGAYHGRGKRASVYGAFLLACYNPSSQNFESICNIGTGFSEALLEKLHTALLECEIDKPKPYYLHTASNVQQPDVWFESKVVWEVKTADLSLSPKYMAAKGMEDKEGKGRGISLRFPRFVRERDDKKPEDATTASQVAEMYRRQDVVANNDKGGSKSGGVDDDFEY